jgi:hypothetical protein
MVGGGASTAEEVAISQYMRGAWTAFAKDPANGLLRYEGGWPEYSTKGQSLIRLAFNNQTGTNLAVGNLFDGQCKNIPEVTSPVRDPSTTQSPSPNGVGRVQANILAPAALAGVMVAVALI